MANMQNVLSYYIPRLGFVYKGVDSTVIMTDILGRGRHHRTPIVEKEATI